jgi:hypothetical protein
MREQVNLLEETTSILARHQKTPSDVRFVTVASINSGKYEDLGPCSGSWDDFAALANFTYDSGYGGAEVAEELKVVGDDWWLERGEYDGSEWWEFKQLPEMPKCSQGLVTVLSYEPSDD